MKLLILLLFPIVAWGNPMVDMMLRPSVELSVNETEHGSGTVIKVTEEGAYILTNYHVVADAKKIVVRFYSQNDAKYEATIYSVEPAFDIAVVFAPHLCMSQAQLGRPEDVQLFQESICIGMSSRYPTAPSRGMMTQLDYHRDGRLLYRSDCNITFGNSGGGLYVEVDNVWKLVGMPTAVHTHKIQGNFAPVSFLGFMVRIDDILKHLEEHGILP
jgi:S1-C subfamily serine protease